MSVLKSYGFKLLIQNFINQNSMAMFESFKNFKLLNPLKFYAFKTIKKKYFIFGMISS